MSVDYDVACARYASDQGLDPIGTILTLSGIPWNLEQTGGFCMVINVEHDHPDLYLWLTAWEPDGVLIGVYNGATSESIGDGDGWHDGYLEVDLPNLATTVNELRHR